LEETAANLWEYVGPSAPSSAAGTSGRRTRGLAPMIEKARLLETHLAKVFTYL
jgi:hypothetical protein